MIEPREQERKELQTAVARIKMVAAGDFEIFLNWLRRERDQRDVENRRKGFENGTTEAEALSTILNFVDGDDE